MRDLAYDLASNVARMQYHMLPEEVVEITKKFILDTFATAIAGSSAPGCSIVAEQIKEWGGREEASVLVFGGKVPSPQAAFINSMMAHALDFDDTHDEAVLHANVSVLPAALATAERKGNVSGKDLIVAVAAGVDLMCRLGLGIIGPLSWVLSATTGYFGSAAASGKILGLDEIKLLNAMGIAYSQCSGNLQVVIDGALVKRMQPAFAAKAGVLSSILAQKGITGVRNTFEGQCGFYPLYHQGKYDREKIVKDLGKIFEGANLAVKLYPCCRYTHASIDVTLSIVQENGITPKDVYEVIAHVTQNTYDAVGRPFEIRESPQVDAQFSIPYTTAVAIAKRSVSIDDFFVENIKANYEVLELSKKVRVIVDQQPIARGLTPCVVDIRTKAGEVYSRRVEILRGDPRKPVGMEEIANKFRGCAKFSAKPLDEETVEEIIKAVRNLENISDISKVVELATCI